MKNKSKKIATLLCSLLIIGSSVAMRTTTADAWGWKKTKVDKYYSKSYNSKKYYSEDDMLRMSKIMDNTAKKGIKNYKSVGKEAFKGAFKGGGLSSIKNIFKKQKATAKDINNTVKEMNKMLNMKGYDAFK